MRPVAPTPFQKITHSLADAFSALFDGHRAGLRGFDPWQAAGDGRYR